MRYLPFSVVCKSCGTIVKPEASPTKGIERTLRGEYNTCPKCEYSFRMIIVPNRPITKKLVEGGIAVNPLVCIRDYKGKPPMGVAY